jgi:hypothetical protein
LKYYTIIYCERDELGYTTKVEVLPKLGKDAKQVRRIVREWVVDKHLGASNFYVQLRYPNIAVIGPGCNGYTIIYNLFAKEVEV